MERRSNAVAVRLPVPFCVENSVTWHAPKIKVAPFPRPRFKEAKWWVMSGKAMQDAIPPAGTAFRELSSKDEESEGHCFEFAASLLPWNKALAKPKVD